MKFAFNEIVNIYDTGLIFGPIHRVLFAINSEGLIKFIGDNLGRQVEYLNNYKKRIDNSKYDLGLIFENNGTICFYEN